MTRARKHQRPNKAHAAQDMRWVPEVSGSGELVLKRTELPGNERAGEMHYPFAQGLTFVARRWRNLLNEELRELGQSQARWGALYWIAVFGESVNQTELADRIGVEQPTLGRVLRDLEEEGLIERVVAEDRRAKAIRLTPAAKPLMRQINRIQESVRVKLLRGIDAEDLATCMAVFARILANFENR
jgi:MarR family transcriptional regulator, transcriptional regulator for hemolysin